MSIQTTNFRISRLPLFLQHICWLITSPSLPQHAAVMYQGVHISVALVLISQNSSRVE
jgi:hypothetical protein